MANSWSVYFVLNFAHFYLRFQRVESIHECAAYPVNGSFMQMCPGDGCEGKVQIHRELNPKSEKTRTHNNRCCVSAQYSVYFFFCSCALCTVPWPASWFALVKKFTYFVVFSLHTNKKMLLAKPHRENTQKNSKVRFVFRVIPFTSVSFFHAFRLCFH